MVSIGDCHVNSTRDRDEEFLSLFWLLIWRPTERGEGTHHGARGIFKRGGECLQRLPSAANVIAPCFPYHDFVKCVTARSSPAQTSFAARNANSQTERTRKRTEQLGYGKERKWPKDKWLSKCGKGSSQPSLILPHRKEGKKRRGPKERRSWVAGEENVHQEMPSRVHKTIHCLLVDVSYMWRSRIHTPTHG